MQNKFDELVDAIGEQLGQHGLVGAGAGVDIDRLLATLRDYESNRADWARYAMADQSRSYTRNLVDDVGGNANLLVLVWNAGCQSAIHDHSNAQ